MKTYKKLGYEYTLSKVKGSEFQRVKIKSSKDIAYFAKVLYKDDIEIYESFFIITLNQANIITGWAKISQGGISATIVDVRLVSKIAIDSLSSCIVLIHNHPSGNLFPSKSDDLITTKIKEGLSLFDIKVLDHIILTERNKYFSDRKSVV